MMMTFDALTMARAIFDRNMLSEAIGIAEISTNLQDHPFGLPGDETKLMKVLDVMWAKTKPFERSFAIAEAEQLRHTYEKIAKRSMLGNTPWGRAELAGMQIQEIGEFSFQLR